MRVAVNSWGDDLENHATAKDQGFQKRLFDPTAQRHETPIIIESASCSRTRNPKGAGFLVPEPSGARRSRSMSERRKSAVRCRHTGQGRATFERVTP